jgi:hypothetical protein
MKKRGEFVNLVSGTFLHKLRDRYGHDITGPSINRSIASQIRQGKELYERQINPSTSTPLGCEPAKKLTRKDHEI